MLSMPMQLDSVQAFVSSNGELAKGVVERDEEVDRWYFLLVRLVRAAISDTYLLEKIKSPQWTVSTLDYSRLYRNLRRLFSNNCRKYSRWCKHPKGRAGVAREDWNVGERHVQRRSGRCALPRPQTSIIRGTQFKDTKKQLSQAEAQLAGSARPLVNHLVAVTIALNRMCEISVDISDLTITR